MANVGSIIQHAHHAHHATTDHKPHLTCELKPPSLRLAHCRPRSSIRRLSRPIFPQSRPTSPRFTSHLQRRSLLRYLGPHKQSWLIIGTFVKALLTMAAALTIWKSGSSAIADDCSDPAWTNGLSFAAIIFMSASLGVQGIQGKRLNTQFTTMIVLTTVWVELMSDPSLFNIRRKVITRDHKLIAASSLFIGGFVSRAILGRIGSAGTLGVAVGLRVLITLAWLFIPGKQKRGSEEKK